MPLKPRALERKDFFGRLNGGSTVAASEKKSLTPPEVEALFQRMVALRRESQEFHTAYQQESRQFLYVKNGEPEKLAALQSGYRYGRSSSMGNMAQSDLDQWRCAFIVAVTLYTRFAVEGGLDQETAYALSDAYLTVVHRINEPERVYEMFLGVGVDFASRVRESRLSWVPAVRLCRDHISKRLHFKITVAELAEQCGLSPNYLSALFRRQTGMTLKEYILKEKLEAARYLLLTTDITVAEAAVQFAFPSHSSFAREFQKKYGLPPAKYRCQQHSTAWDVIC